MSFHKYNYFKQHFAERFTYPVFRNTAYMTVLDVSEHSQKREGRSQNIQTLLALYMPWMALCCKSKTAHCNAHRSVENRSLRGYLSYFCPLKINCVSWQMSLQPVYTYNPWERFQHFSWQATSALHCFARKIILILNSNLQCCNIVFPVLQKE